MLPTLMKEEARPLVFCVQLGHSAGSFLWGEFTCSYFLSIIVIVLSILSLGCGHISEIWCFL